MAFDTPHDSPAQARPGILAARIEEALAFDDVLIAPAYSQVLPGATSTVTRLTRTIGLNIPLISAAMDTVTEYDMAITMAQLGGIGVIHKNLTPDEQAAHVHRVKKFEAGMVVNPLTVHPDQTLAEWRDRLDAYEAQAFPLRGGNHLDGGILKTFADGVIESRTASMLAPYEDDAGAGLPAWEPSALDAFTAEADRRGWQVEMHAIGDRGIRMALDAFEHAAAANGSWAGDPHGFGAARARPGTHERRHRVEHIETIDPADIPRFARLGVVASMQPYHGDPSPNQISVWAGNIGPERASRAWAWRSIHEAGGRLAFGSDWPVVPYDPFIALNNAVNRQTTDGRPAGGWLPAERLTLADALEAYTAGSAFAAFADHRRGRVTVGMDADVIILDRDLLAAGPSAIIGTSVRLTVLGGRVVHRSEELT